MTGMAWHRSGHDGAVQPFLFRQFPGVLPLFGGQRGIIPGFFLFLFFFIHKPIL